MALTSSMLHRVQRGITIETRILPADTLYVQLAKDATLAYSESAKALKDPKHKEDRDRLGPPFIHVWDSMVTATIKLLEEEQGLEAAAEDDQNSLKKMKEYQAKIASIDVDKRVEILCQEIKSCRISRTYDKETAKLEVSLKAGTDSDKIWVQVMDVMICSKGGKRKNGPAPQAPQERQLRAMLEALNQ
eukprot:TRINITY_DN67831_c0_g1_i1.p2 TRINITY_DN67831_c0_g1~~TRINITY_DN67831_c0_g1_i1.p2  ORF type:complete len:221 (-),score=55.78 TRINITY_DN67831_c0_g1_i1:364-930(-)